MREIGNWEMANMIGYTPITNYWERLKRFGIHTEREIENIFKECKDDYKKFTEFVMVLNHLCWAYHDIKYYATSDWYGERYYKYHEWAYENLKDEALAYYFRTTD